MHTIKKVLLLFTFVFINNYSWCQNLTPKEDQRIDSLMHIGIVKDMNSGLDYFTGYSYRTLYDWDQYFEAIVQIHRGWRPDYIKNGVIVFLNNQHPDGFIARSVPSDKWDGKEHVKPFLAQIALLVIDNYKDSTWILNDKYFNRLKKYIDYWLNNMDSNHDGLSEWMSAPHTGMDNQHERAGYWEDRCSEGVDLNCYLVRETRAFAVLAEMKGDKALAKEYREKSRQLKDNINKYLWDEKDGFYYDRKTDPSKVLSKSLPYGAKMNYGKQKGNLIPVRSASAFTTLFAEVATPERAERIVKNYLLNPQEFWSPYPISALAKSEPCYSTKYMPSDLGCNWRANTWIPVNYMVCQGLKYYGMNRIAEIVAEYTQKLVTKSGDREYYNAETGEGLGLNPFWGWSLLAHYMANEPPIMTIINHKDGLGYAKSKLVILDNYYNHEVDHKSKLLSHYTWNDYGLGGFSQLGQIFKNEGAILSSLTLRPTIQNLSPGSVYIIVDPDNTRDNPHPSYMDETAACAIKAWVEQGGKLVIMANDYSNCDLEHINILSEKFGIHFNPVSILNEGDIFNNQRNLTNCYLDRLPKNRLFEKVNKIFIKGCSTISCTKMAIPLLKTRNKEIIIAESKIGKGIVLAITDPWLYNEYMDNGIMPNDFQNHQAAINFVKLLLK